MLSHLFINVTNQSPLYYTACPNKTTHNHLYRDLKDHQSVKGRDENFNYLRDDRINYVCRELSTSSVRTQPSILRSSPPFSNVHPLSLSVSLLFIYFYFFETSVFLSLYVVLRSLPFLPWVCLYH